MALSFLSRAERRPDRLDIERYQGDNTMALRIPASERENMTSLVSASPQLLDAMIQVLPTCAPVLFSDALTSALFEKLRDAPGATRARIDGIVETLLAVYSALRISDSERPSGAAAEIVEAVRKDGRFGTPPDGWDTFQKRLELLLSDDKVLGLSAKAVSVSSESERHVHGFRVLTDARPIFGENAKDGPQGFAVIHTLQIEYYADGQSREWFVSLDGDDLENLQGTAERAIAKERSLRTMLEKLGTPVLSWKVRGDGK
jgi:hypothetical protein